MEVAEIELTPEQIEALPKVRAYWSHSYRDYDLWLTARERLTYGLLWIFECPHGRWLLIGAPATVHGKHKKIWRQGVLKLPEQHRNCEYKLYAVRFSDLDTMLEVYFKFELY